MITIDQEKAFDKIDRNFLFKTLEKLNLGKNFITAIKQTMKNSKSIIINNGYMGKPFSVAEEFVKRPNIMMLHSWRWNR